MARKKNSNSLNWSSSEINHNFRIKVYGCGINKLVGVSGLESIVCDIDLINSMVDKAFELYIDCYTRKLRRGIKVSFYLK